MEEQRKEQVSYPLPLQGRCSADAETPLIGRRDSSLQRTFISCDHDHAADVRLPSAWTVKGGRRF